MPGNRRSATLLDRDAQLAALVAAAHEAAAGRGSVALVTGEAGIGKTSLIRAFLDLVPLGMRTLTGACDDLLVPRPFGPLRDAVAGHGGVLERTLADDGGTDDVLRAAMDQLRGPRPTVLVVEDIHWADDATLDVLRYLVRRLEELRALLVLTFRDAAGPRHSPFQQLLGAVAGTRVHRLPLPALSVAAVRALASGSDRNPEDLHLLTGGNPFYVTEALAAPVDRVPATVVDTVWARMRRLGPDARAACEQLSVVPSHAGFDLATALFGPGLDALAEAEEHGIVEARLDGVAFRHELARRAVEYALPAIRRRHLNHAVVVALHGGARVELARLVHHAVGADDAATVAVYAPLAGRQAARAGSHRQALAHFETALRYADALAADERAALVDDYAWELHIAHRFGDAVAAGREAVALRERVGEPVALGETLLRLSRYLFLAGDTGDAEAAIDRAARVLAPIGSAPALAAAATNQGAILALTGRSGDAVPVLEQARTMAGAADRTDLVALCLNYLGVAKADLGDEDGLRLLGDSLATALHTGDHESAARAYTNLGELLYREGRWPELAVHLDAGLGFTREHGFWSHAYNLEVHLALLHLRRGEWDAAEKRLRDLVDAVADPGMLTVYSVPALARVRLRRGAPDVEALLETAWQRATDQRMLLGLAYAGIAYVEWAWLTGRPERAAAVRDALLRRTELAGTAAIRGELLRYLARAGLGGEPFDGCPLPWAAGLRGDWRAAARAWELAGDPYEEALELAESGEVEPTLRALHILDELGAGPAAAVVRLRLRRLGVRRIPRGVVTTTRANPAGLTARQVDVLDLLAGGLTNAEIARRLVVSVRTVDHHVSAILGKLGVATRREAAATVPSLSRATPAFGRSS
ncbi:MAG TPA: AAA family ATPase [Micromonosporaceae bacterium]|nr:AAA family ATPase [Micromonosporaceae bacterium]